MKHLLLLLALLGLPVLGLATASPVWAEEEPATAEDEVAEEEAAEPAIAWAEDYESAKEKAAAEDKGLFVYLTPTWFT